MRMQLSQQVADLLGQSELVIITERVDDVGLLIGQMVKMGLPEILDRHIPRHWTQQGLSWGWTAVIWGNTTSVQNLALTYYTHNSCIVSEAIFCV